MADADLDRWLAEQRTALAGDLVALLDVEEGLCEALRTALVEDLHDALDIDTGLAAIVLAAGPSAGQGPWAPHPSVPRTSQDGTRTPPSEGAMATESTITRFTGRRTMIISVAALATMIAVLITAITLGIALTADAGQWHSTARPAARVPPTVMPNAPLPDSYQKGDPAQPPPPRDAAPPRAPSANPLPDSYQKGPAQPLPPGDAAPPRAPSANPRSAITMEIFFATNSVQLLPAEVARLDSFLPFLTQTSGRITVTGYTDGLGTTEHNNGLSRRRAEIMAQWLIRRGIQVERIIVTWHGEEDAHGQVSDPALRRVEIAVQIP